MKRAICNHGIGRWRADCIHRHDKHHLQAGRTRLAIGKIKVSSRITMESGLITYCVIHMAEHALNGGARSYRGPAEYERMKEEISRAFGRGEFADIVHLMDTHFGMHTYSLVDLFRDQQRKILNLLIGKTIEEFSDTYKRMYEYNRIMMGYLRETGMPVPVDKMIEYLDGDGSDISLIIALQEVMEMVRLLPLDINYWHLQNIYHRLSQTGYLEMVSLADTGDVNAAKWIGAFKYLGELLFFNINAVLDNTQRRMP